MKAVAKKHIPRRLNKSYISEVDEHCKESFKEFRET